MQTGSADAHAWVSMRAWPAQNIVGKCLKRIAGKDRGRLAKGDMRRGAAAAGRIVIHGGKIVMHQRIAMHAFKRGAGVKRILLRHAEQSRRFQMSRNGRKRLPLPSAA